MSGQGEVMIGRRIRGGLLALAAIAGLSADAAGAAQPAVERATPSGLPVPRYVVLKFGEVNARAGPGDDHRLLWIYRVKSLPVQVVAETAEWRRICDPEKGLAWVHRRTTDGRRTVMNMSGAPVPVYHEADAASRRVADLNPRGLAALVECTAGWCQIKADGVTGWARSSELWGTAETPQCR
jgi:SH3-like domain-containing protein